LGLFARSRVDQPDRPQNLVDRFFTGSGGGEDPNLLTRTTEAQKEKRKGNGRTFDSN